MSKITSEPERIKPKKIRKGKWNWHMETECDLPNDVKTHCDEISESDNDWECFMSDDGQLWLVTKMWEDKGSFTIAASVVKYESELKFL